MLDSKELRPKRILLHACCGPCTIYPLRCLREEGWMVHGLFYNPYIQPHQEHHRRLTALQQLAEREGLPLIVREDYDLEDYIRQVAFRESQRCIVCYSKRIEVAARMAAKSRFEAFSTTLLYSKMQNHALIRELCESASRRHGIVFLYRDFRQGWREGQEKAQAMGIYRQQYCGCILSEKERYCAGA